MLVYTHITCMRTVYSYMHTQKHTHPHANTCSGYTCTHKLCTGTRNMRANMCTQVYTYTFAHRYMHGHIDAHMQIHAQKCTHRYIYAYRDTFTQAYTAHMFAHRYTQAYIYTQMRTCTQGIWCVHQYTMHRQPEGRREAGWREAKPR